MHVGADVSSESSDNEVSDDQDYDTAFPLTAKKILVGDKNYL